MDVKVQLERVEALRRFYEATLEVEDANSRKAIQAFHTWHKSSVEFFAEVLGVEIAAKLSKRSIRGTNLQ